MVDVVLRHPCTLEAVCCFNTELEEVQRSAMKLNNVGARVEVQTICNGQTPSTGPS